VPEIFLGADLFRTRISAFFCPSSGADARRTRRTLLSHVPSVHSFAPPCLRLRPASRIRAKKASAEVFFGRGCVGPCSVFKCRALRRGGAAPRPAPRDFPKSCPRRHLRRLAPAMPGLWVLFGSLALRGFRAAYAVLTPARIVVVGFCARPQSGKSPSLFPGPLLPLPQRSKHVCRRSFELRRPAVNGHRKVAATVYLAALLLGCTRHSF